VDAYLNTQVRSSPHHDLPGGFSPDKQSIDLYCDTLWMTTFCAVQIFILPVQVLISGDTTMRAL